MLAGGRDCGPRPFTAHLPAPSACPLLPWICLAQAGHSGSGATCYQHSGQPIPNLSHFHRFLQSESLAIHAPDPCHLAELGLKDADAALGLGAGALGQLARGRALLLLERYKEAGGWHGWGWGSGWHASV